MPSAHFSRSALAVGFFLALGIVGEVLHLWFHAVLRDADIDSFAADWFGIMLEAVAIVGLFYSAGCMVEARAGSRCQVQFWGFIGAIVAVIFVTFS